MFFKKDEKLMRVKKSDCVKMMRDIKEKINDENFKMPSKRILEALKFTLSKVAHFSNR